MLLGFIDNATIYLSRHAVENIGIRGEQDSAMDCDIIHQYRPMKKLQVQGATLQMLFFRYTWYTWGLACSNNMKAAPLRAIED
jgi:hypothetical protein